VTVGPTAEGGMGLVGDKDAGWGGDRRLFDAQRPGQHPSVVVVEVSSSGTPSVGGARVSGCGLLVLGRSGFLVLATC
jgi:hypothetical protein